MVSGAVAEGDLRVVETEAGLGLVDGDESRDTHYVLVEFTANKLQIREDKRLLWVESNGDDILCVLFREADNVVDGEGGLEEELFVVRHHDNKRAVKNILQPPIIVETISNTPTQNRAAMRKQTL